MFFNQSLNLCTQNIQLCQESLYTLQKYMVVSIPVLFQLATETTIGGLKQLFTLNLKTIIMLAFLRIVILSYLSKTLVVTTTFFFFKPICLHGLYDCIIFVMHNISTLLCTYSHIILRKVCMYMCMYMYTHAQENKEANYRYTYTVTQYMN